MYVALYDTGWECGKGVKFHHWVIIVSPDFSISDFDTLNIYWTVQRKKIWKQEYYMLGRMISTELLYITSPERRFVVLSLYNFRFDVTPSEMSEVAPIEKVGDVKRTVRSVNIILRWQFRVMSKFVNVLYFGQCVVM